MCVRPKDVEFLLSLGADKRLTNKDGDTAYDLAKKYKKSANIYKLLETEA